MKLTPAQRISLAQCSPRERASRLRYMREQDDRRADARADALASVLGPLLTGGALALVALLLF